MLLYIGPTIHDTKLLCTISLLYFPLPIKESQPYPVLYKIVHSWTVRIQHSLARPKTHFHHPNSPTPLTRGTEPPYFIVSVLLPVLQSWATVAFVHSRVKTPESVAVSAQRPTGLP